MDLVVAGVAAGTQALHSKRVVIMQNIEIPFTLEERDLILKKTFTDPALTDRLKLAEVKEGHIKVSFSLNEIDELAGAIAAEANHTEDEALQEKLDDLYDRIADIESRFS